MLLIFVFVLAAFAQHSLAQNIFSTGTGTLPACGSTCAKMNQAAQACGGISSANQGTWICFCQSAYLKPLYTTPSGTCDDTCTNAADAQQLMTWYTGNCGTDNGATEHASLGGATTTTGAGSSATGASSSSSSSQSGGNAWWSSHYQWVIMLIALAVGLTLFALLAIWLRRRHDRKQDQLRGGFNVGITERSASAAAPMSQKTSRPPPPGPPQQAYMAGGLEEAASGAGSPARSREAFMPYGYGYSRSERSIGAATPTRQSQDGRAVGRHPLAREMEDATPFNETEGYGKGKKRVLVREKQVDGG